MQNPLFAIWFDLHPEALQAQVDGAPDLSVDAAAVPAACKAIVTNVNQIFE